MDQSRIGSPRWERETIAFHERDWRRWRRRSTRSRSVQRALEDLASGLAIGGFLCGVPYIDGHGSVGACPHGEVPTDHSRT